MGGRGTEGGKEGGMGGGRINVKGVWEKSESTKQEDHAPLQIV